MSDRFKDNALAVKLRALRESKGWSLADASDHIGCSKGHLHDMEKGHTFNPCVDTIIALAAAYGCPPVHLFNAATAVWGIEA